MVARAALIIVLACIGCGGDDDYHSGQDFGAGGGSAGGGSDLATPPGCLVTIDQLAAPYVPTTLVASTDAAFADATWSLELAGSTAPALKVDATGRVATVAATVAGTYTFTVRFANNPCVGMSSIDLLDPTGATMLYRFRGLPPSGSKSAPTDTMVSLTGGTPLANRPVRLDSGVAANGVLTDATGAAIAGEIRFVGTSVPDADTRAGASGTFSVPVGTTDYYRPLIIPDSPALAPHLGAETEGYQLSLLGFAVSAGAPVSGSVSDGVSPIAGAGVVLRAGLLPSGLGTSAADGTFTLRAEALTTAYQLGVSSDGWPTLTLDDIVVPSAGLTATIAYRVPRVAVGGSVTASSGGAVAGARVTIESLDAIAGAANVTIGGSTLAASGRVSQVVSSGALGQLPALQLPAATYVVTVEPPAGSSDGLTTYQVTAPSTWPLALKAPVSLAGTVKDAAGHAVAGAKVTATALSGLGAAPATTTDAGGKYTLLVGAGTASSLHVEPLAADKLGDATIFVAAGATQANVTLGAGLQVAGTVVDANNVPVPAVLVEAMCWDCASPTVIKSGVSDASGNYKLYLPDPGKRVVVDAGATGGDGGVD